jgi:hypothetical protein
MKFTPEEFDRSDGCDNVYWADDIWMSLPLGVIILSEGGSYRSYLMQAFVYEWFSKSYHPPVKPPNRNLKLRQTQCYQRKAPEPSHPCIFIICDVRNSRTPKYLMEA